MINSLLLEFAGNTNDSFGFNTSTTPADSITTEVDLRQNIQNRSSQHGAYDAFLWLGTRVIRVEGTLLGTSYSDYTAKRQQMLAMVAPRPGLHYASHSWSGFRYPTGDHWIAIGDLTLDIDGNNFYIPQVSLDGYPELPLDTSIGPSAGRYMVAFKALDPYLYGDGLSSVSAAKTVPVTMTGGNAYSQRFAATIQGPQKLSGGACTLTLKQYYNYGTSEVRVTLTIPNITLNINEYIEVDFYNREIRKLVSGVATAIYDYTVSPSWEYFFIAPSTHDQIANGINNIRFDSTGNDASPGAYQMFYFPAYLI